MSAFNGILAEYPWISIDSFLEINCQQSKVFFISHIHTDHLRGLNEPTFSQYVMNNPFTRIYCSETSRYFLSTLSAYKHLSKFYSVINVNQSVTIENPADKNISITLTCYGSGHCPGSLMLLIEGSHGTVLYTGDFRLYSNQSNRHRIILSKKPIDSLYIDMTFFEPSIRQLPKREQSCEQLIHLIEQYGNRSFYIKTSARVGYEYIFASLYHHFGISIHVNSEQYHLYNCLPLVQQALTTDSNRTRIHACWPKCSHTKLSIKVVLSVLWFTLQQQSHCPLVRMSTDYYRLCYSLHSSYNEICTFVKQISPNRVYPIALPSFVTPERFNELLTKLNIYPIPRKNFEPNSAVQQIKRRYHTIENIDDDNDELDFGYHDSQEKNEQQLYNRISNLQFLAAKKCKYENEEVVKSETDISTDLHLSNHIDLVMAHSKSRFTSQQENHLK